MAGAEMKQCLLASNDCTLDQERSVVEARVDALPPARRAPSAPPKTPPTCMLSSSVSSDPPRPLRKPPVPRVSAILLVEKSPRRDAVPPPATQDRPCELLSHDQDVPEVDVMTSRRQNLEEIMAEMWTLNEEMQERYLHELPEETALGLLRELQEIDIAKQTGEVIEDKTSSHDISEQTSYQRSRTPSQEMSDDQSGADTQRASQLPGANPGHKLFPGLATGLGTKGRDVGDMLESMSQLKEDEQVVTSALPFSDTCMQVTVSCCRLNWLCLAGCLPECTPNQRI